MPEEEKVKREEEKKGKKVKARKGKGKGRKRKCKGTKMCIQIYQCSGKKKPIFEFKGKLLVGKTCKSIHLKIHL